MYDPSGMSPGVAVFRIRILCMSESERLVRWLKRVKDGLCLISSNVNLEPPATLESSGEDPIHLDSYMQDVSRPQDWLC